MKAIDFIEGIKEGYYVDENGEIYSSLSGSIKIMKQHTAKNGYKNIGFQMVDGTRKTLRAHRVVAMAFLKSIDGMNFVNHKNGIKDDNRVCNLEWSNDSLNMIHAY
ncbi:MAG: HNH endonuclease [Paraclostridium sp.]